MLAVQWSNSRNSQKYVNLICLLCSLNRTFMYFCLPPVSSFCLPLDAKLFLPHVNGSLANYYHKAWRRRFWVFLSDAFLVQRKWKLWYTNWKCCNCYLDSKGLHSWLNNINTALLISSFRSNIFYHAIRKKDPVILCALTAMEDLTLQSTCWNCEELKINSISIIAPYLKL